MNLITKFTSLFKRKTSCSKLPQSFCLEEEFKKRYKLFREIILANNQTLEIMAEFEEILSLNKPFNLNYLKSRCTTLLVNVYKMIQALINLTGGRYKDLEVVFNRLSSEIEEILASRKENPLEKSFVLDLSEITLKDIDLVGQKMATLGEIKNKLGLDVPEGFVITSSATMYFLKKNNLDREIDRLFTLLEGVEDLESLYKTCARIEKLILRASIPKELEEEIMRHYKKIREKYGPEVLVAMRSSAIGEDSIHFSFAGQYKTQLKVSAEALLDTYKKILASKYHASAVVYRTQKGLRDEDIVMCVGCMVMVDTRVSGVAFSCSPYEPKTPCLEIYATKGLAENIVQGKQEADYYKICKTTEKVIEKRLVQENQPVLTEKEIKKLREQILKIEKHFGCPQEIEWGITQDDRLFILQSRPLLLYEEETEEDICLEIEGKEVLAESGISIYKGVACGKAFIVRTDLDILTFPEGAVLVVLEPLPKWATLLKKACALICEKGHPATHLAIVARELKIPSLFGVKDITTKLKNETLITVDCTRKKIYLGCCESLLKTQIPQSNFMIHSPVYKIFKKITDLILPLNLTDPDSPFFKPRYCKTLHDIIRFCHEKAVDAMFSLGIDLDLTEKKAKRLVSKTPGSWWIINLKDGFKETFDPKKKKITLEEIESIPMKAIWEGMIAKPWEGPPPLDFKGLGSVFFWSTMRPELDPALAFEPREKNYVMVSKNFCHLGMKLGYHYTTVEAYIGEFISENYIYFYYKGGGADPERRLLRIEFISEILEKIGFYTVIRLDALFAHIEKNPAEDLYQRLKVLGYLLRHTRQADMIMSNPSLANTYKKQIYEDITHLFGGNLGLDTNFFHIN